MILPLISLGLSLISIFICLKALIDISIAEKRIVDLEESLHLLKEDNGLL